MKSVQTRQTSVGVRIGHGALGTVVGGALGVFAASQLSNVPRLVGFGVVLAAAVAAAILAFRYGATFWSSLIESAGDA